MFGASFMLEIFSQEQLPATSEILAYWAHHTETETSAPNLLKLQSSSLLIAVKWHGRGTEL